MSNARSEDLKSFEEVWASGSALRVRQVIVYDVEERGFG